MPRVVVRGSNRTGAVSGPTTSGAHLRTRHTVGGAEKHLNNKWGPVVPLVFGHNNNKELLF